MRILSNREIDENEKAANLQETDVSQEEKTRTELASYIFTCWTKAKQAKIEVENQILSNMRQVKGEYDPDKLAAIKAVESSEVFMMITDTKCRNAYAWLYDLLFQPGAKPWSIEPTPIPELPADVVEEMYTALTEKIMETAVTQAMSTGMPIDQQKVMGMMQELMDIMTEEAKISMRRVAKEKAQEMEKKIDDQLFEGNFMDQFKECLQDIILHTGIMKGPIIRKVKVKVPKRNKASGKVTYKVEEKIVPQYERRHPLFIYPAPGSKGINDGFLIDRIAMTPKQIQGLIGQPGFNDAEVNAVLAEIGSLKGWLDTQSLDQTISDMTDGGANAIWDSDKIDCIEFHGTAKGEHLQQWGVKKKLVPEKDHWYDIVAWQIGRHVMKAALNTDPLGEKPFSKCSFEEKNDSFWGVGLPQVICDIQQVCNACARAIVNNVAIGSGPQVERNIDRIPAGDLPNKKLRPWKVWDVTETQMSTAPALKFYAPPMVVERLTATYTSFARLADEHSGIPAYAHGDSRVGGAGNTASGLSMLITSAARGIKLLIGEIDNNIIAPTIKRQYDYNVMQGENYDLVCDYTVVAKGSAALLVKEQLATRRLEALQLTNNPIDLQLVGPDARRGMLRDVLNDLGIDVDKYIPEEKLSTLMQSMMPAQPQGPAQPGMITQGPGTPPSPGLRTTDQAGAPAQGVDTTKPMGMNG